MAGARALTRALPPAGGFTSHAPAGDQDQDQDQSQDHDQDQDRRNPSSTALKICVP